MAEIVPYSAFLDKKRAKQEEQTQKRRGELRIIATRGFIFSLVEIVVDNEDMTFSTYDGVVASEDDEYYIGPGATGGLMINDRVFFKVKEDDYRRIAVGLILMQRDN